METVLFMNWKLNELPIHTQSELGPLVSKKESSLPKPRGASTIPIFEGRTATCGSFPISAKGDAAPSTVTSITKEEGSKVLNEASTPAPNNGPNALIARLVLAIMIGAAAFAAMAALSYANDKSTLSCAFSSVVCLIAAIHYAGILYIRNQGNDDMGSEPMAPLTPEQRFAQDENVDLLRYSDWVITLPLLGFELSHTLREICTVRHPNRPYLADSSTALLLGLVVLFGAIYRFAFFELRSSQPMGINRWIGLPFWLVASGLFLWVYIVLLSTASLVSSNPKANAIYWFVFVWIVYMLVSIITSVVILCRNISVGEPLSPQWTLFKDVCYGVADVISKAALAFYVALDVLM